MQAIFHGFHPLIRTRVALNSLTVYTHPMPLFTPSFIKRAKGFQRMAKLMLDYRKDIVSQEIATSVETEIARLKTAIAGRNEADVMDAAKSLDAACEKLGPPLFKNSWAENAEVIVGTLAIVLGIRAYFLQPFTIPTGSMQPTLNGIVGHPKEESPPPALQRIWDRAVLGRSWFDIIAKDDESVLSTSERKKWLFFTETVIQTDRNTYAVSAPERTIAEHFLKKKNRFKAGEPVIRGYVTSGDHVIVNMMAYHFRKPIRGEVFVFTTRGIRTGANMMNPGGPSQFYIKRLAGVPGDNLRIEPPKLFINGDEAQEATFKRVASGTFESPNEGYRGYSHGPRDMRFAFLGDDKQSIELQDGKYFALGDNSYFSSDSRDWGTVPQQNLVGAGLVVFWPFGNHWGRIQ
jgi:signal peptidase I